MNYTLNTKTGKYKLSFSNYFTKKLADNKGVDFKNAMDAAFKAFDTISEATESQTPDVSPFINELVYIVQAGIQAAEAEEGRFEKLPLDQVEFILMGAGSDPVSAFKTYGEIITECMKALFPQDLGKGEPKVPKKKAAARK